MAAKVRSADPGGFSESQFDVWSEPLRPLGVPPPLTDGSSAVFGPTFPNKCQNQMSNFSRAEKEKLTCETGGISTVAAAALERFRRRFFTKGTK